MTTSKSRLGSTTSVSWRLHAVRRCQVRPTSTGRNVTQMQKLRQKLLATHGSLFTGQCPVTISPDGAGCSRTKVRGTQSTEGTMFHSSMRLIGFGSPAREPVHTMAQNPITDPVGNLAGCSSSMALAVLMIGDQVAVWREGGVRPSREPPADVHAAELLAWLTDTACAGHWVSAADISRLLYPEFCRLRAWRPRPMQSILKHLKRLTKKRQRDVETTANCWRRNEVQYRVPRRSRTRQ